MSDQSQSVTKSMQTDIPARQESKLAWYGPELHSDTDKWVFQLDDAATYVSDNLQL